MGELIFIPRIPFRLGDLSDEIKDDARECVFSVELRLAGLIFSRRLLEVVLCL
jgi:hypothetical protein